MSTQMILAQVPSYVPTNGLVGYWPFNGNANDVTSNANNGTVSDATLTADRFGNANKAYSFNGINNYITATRIYQSAFSVSLWFNTSGSQLYNPLIDAFDANWEIQLKNASPDYVSFITASNYQELLSSSLTQNNIWYNLICTYSNNVVKFYINGILKDQFTAYVLPNNIGNYYFGASMTGADQFFNGDLDDIGIWNRALTQDEITSLYYADNTCQSLVINTGVLSFNPPTYQNTVTIYPNWIFRSKLYTPFRSKVNTLFRSKLYR